MTDTPLKPKPFAWVMPESDVLDNESTKKPIYTQDQLDAAVRAERERILSHIDGLLETLQEGLMTDAGLSKLDRQKMRAQIDALDVVAAAIREGE